MGIETSVPLKGDWASAERRAQLQERLEEVRSSPDKRISPEVAIKIIAASAASSPVKHKEEPAETGFFTPMNTPRNGVSDSAAHSSAASTVPSNEITPEKLRKERKVFIETHLKDKGIPPRFVSFDAQKASRYYE